jgi:hypothetical protein
LKRINKVPALLACTGDTFRSLNSRESLTAGSCRREKAAVLRILKKVTLASATARMDILVEYRSRNNIGLLPMAGLKVPSKRQTSE